MPVSLPYLSSNKNVGDLFSKISSATVPSTFTQDFLRNTIGLKGSNDRPLIALLRNLGFLDQSNAPTPAYSLLKGKGDVSAKAIADGIRKAYAPLFDANENVHELSGEKLKSLISQVAGADDDMTARIASTFGVLVKQANFKAAIAPSNEDMKNNNQNNEDVPPPDTDDNFRTGSGKGLRAEFQYVIQIQLPSHASEETYLNIFNALRKTFQ